MMSCTPLLRHISALSACTMSEFLRPSSEGRPIEQPLLTIDTFNGARVWWRASRILTKSNTIFSFNPNMEDRRYYRLSFHKRHGQLIEKDYLKHVLAKGRAITARNRQRRLFTNNSTCNGTRGKVWSHVAFEHPATFNTLAMDPEKKKEIIDDLMTFREGKEYYKNIGKAWKRGYLLYGPPGTGKSSMIAAIANLPTCWSMIDVYDLELTAVENNTELRKIFLETTGKSIIVIEDIDCSLDLSGKRKDKNKRPNDKTDQTALPTAIEESDKAGKVTLSGLLNFMDGLWSACGGERIIIFTTNHKEKLDPALIRRGRMDMHIEMSYCTFEAFKVLAKNYLGVENHRLFSSVRELLLEVMVSPADVAEGLMLKNSKYVSRKFDRGVEQEKEEQRKRFKMKEANNNK
ncbi:hypothetical protein LUZ63_016047 [Rhynchospora breviuscula]|uniref:AAA+ ATPase domain-containing protein n=1 Tax=Rhynchospora breviuscula TaxID=2022672 RepID=A0A9Q0CDF6_9POAL|nr:hypothetical protein LUZ63_016047 [Rhynchospora breviuscula]